MSTDLNKIINRHRRYLEIIGFYQIIGGITGIIIIFILGNIHIHKMSFIGIITFAIILAFYPFSIYAGYKIIKEHEKKILYTEIVQYIQILAIALLGFIFSLTAGIALYIGFDYDNEFIFRFHFELISTRAQFHILPEQTMVYTYVNIIPIIILIIMNNSVKWIRHAENLKNDYK